MSDEYLGQMESTLLISFLKVSKIKWWLADPQNPSIIRELKSLFEKVYSAGDLDKNSKMIEIMDGDDVDTTFLVASSALKVVQQLLLPGKSSVCLHTRFNDMVLFMLSQKHMKETAELFTIETAILPQRLSLV